MKAIKKCLSVILALTIITSILCIIPVEVSAASDSSNTRNDDWKDMIEIWKDRYIECINKISDTSSSKKFDLLDVNNNGIPELFFDSGNYVGGKAIIGIDGYADYTLEKSEKIGGLVYSWANRIYFFTGQMGTYNKKVLELELGSFSFDCLFDGILTAKSLTNYDFNNPNDFEYTCRSSQGLNYSSITKDEFDNNLNAVFDVDNAESIDFKYSESVITDVIKNYQNSTDWKQWYIDYITRNYPLHSRFYTPEYALVKINDDDIPELTIKANNGMYHETNKSYGALIGISPGFNCGSLSKYNNCEVKQYNEKGGKYYTVFNNSTVEDISACYLGDNGGGSDITAEKEVLYSRTVYRITTDPYGLPNKRVDEETYNSTVAEIKKYGNKSPEYKSKEQIIKEINEYGVSTPNIDTLKEYEKFCAKSYSGYSNLIPDLKMTYKEIEENYEPLQKYVNNLLSFGWEAKFAFKDSAQIWETVIIDIILKNGTSSENMLHTEKDAYEIAKSFADYVKEAGIEDLAKPVGLNKPSVKAFVKEINDSIDLGSMDFLDKCDVCMEAADTLADFLDNYSNFVAVYKTVNINMKSFISALKTSQLYSDVGAFRRAVDDICANISVDPFKLIENAMKKATLDHLLSYTVNTTAGIVVKVLLGPKAFAAVEFAKYGTIYLMDTLMNVGQISKNNVYLYIIDKIDDAASETFKKLASECKNSDGEKNTKEVIGGVEFFDSLYTYGISICRNWTDAISIDILTAMESGPQFTVKRPHYDLATDYLNLGHASTKNEKIKYVLKRCEDDEKNINNYFNCITNGIIANWYNNLGGTSNYNIKLINYIVKTPLNEEDKYSQLVNNNTTFKTPSIRSKTGYKLSPVWYLDEECTISVPSNYVITENVSFYNRYVPTIFTALTSDGTGLVVTNMGGGGFRSINSVGVNVNTSEIGSDDAGIIPPYISGYRVLELGDDIFCNQDVTSVSIPSTVVSISQNCFKSLSQDTKFTVVANSYAEQFLKKNNIDIDMILGEIGDVNLDGNINGQDVALLSRYVAGWDVYAEIITSMDAADINGDGNINGADSGILSRYISGWNGYDKYFKSFDEETIDITSIFLDKAELTLNKGDSYQLLATIYPSNATNKSVAWKTDNSAVATVDSSGKLTAKSVGNTTITAITTNGKTASCTITVSNAASDTFLFGDVVTDGIISISDLTKISRCVSGMDTFTEEQKILADVNGDGIVNQLDVSLVSDYLANKINIFPIYSLISDYGYCGESVKYVLKKDGSLTIFGKGKMDNGTGSLWKDIKTVSIKKGVTNIGQLAFSDCESLTSITISDSVTSIGKSAFSWCESLSSMTIPNSVTSIGINAFLNCSSITSITIPDSVNSIGSYAFSGCTSLRNITVSQGNTNYSSLGGNLYNKDYTKLIQYAIGNDSGSFILPDSVTSIENWAFRYCTNLNRVTLGKNVKKISVYSFGDCTGLTSIVLPEGLTSIMDYSFFNCPNLKSVSIPRSVISIDSKAFGYFVKKGIKKVENFTINGAVGSAAESYANENGFCFIAS